MSSVMPWWTILQNRNSELENGKRLEVFRLDSIMTNTILRKSSLDKKWIVFNFDE